MRRERFAYGGGMRRVPWWGVVSAAAAPVLMVGGWTVAASVQPRFDPVADTVSELAAQGTPDRWVMSVTFVVVGVCYVITALALRPAGTAGRADPDLRGRCGHAGGGESGTSGGCLPVGAHCLGVDRLGGSDRLARRGLAAGYRRSVGPAAPGRRRGRCGAARAGLVVRRRADHRVRAGGAGRAGGGRRGGAMAAGGGTLLLSAAGLVR